MDQRVVQSLEDLPDGPHVVTIGSFDGVHRGHQYLTSIVTSRARELQIRSLAITFDPLPAEVLRPDKAPPRLCGTTDRTRYMLGQGIDQVVVLHFDAQLASQSAEDFLHDVVQAAQPKMIVVGEDFAFGHKRQGTPEFLANRSGLHGYELVVVDRVNPDDGVEWSSSFIRAKLRDEGDVRSAMLALGRPFRVSGIVQDGDRRGRDLGYPTANLNLPEGQAVPADGIYAAYVAINSRDARTDMPALVYVGTRPTFGSTRRTIEVFLLDFDADLYGREITVDFVERIRGDRAFNTAEELVQQMKHDEEVGRRIFAERGVHTMSSQ